MTAKFLESCVGGKSMVRPWEPAQICRDCRRRMVIAPKRIEPEIVRIRGGFDCPNKVV